MPPDGPVITGRCYCGASRVAADKAPETIAYCHCQDCRRVIGAPAPAFAAFDKEHLRLDPMRPAARPVNPGVTRWFCPECGSALMAQFDYLPDQLYVPLGILDQANALEPALHCHAESALSWVHMQSDIPQVSGSARTALKGSRT